MTGPMKSIAKRIVLGSLALLVAVALDANGDGTAQTESATRGTKTSIEKTKDKMKDAAGEGKDAVKRGVQKAGEVATNVVHEVKVGLQKARVVATNVAAQVEETVTNTVGQAKAKVRDLIQ